MTLVNHFGPPLDQLPTDGLYSPIIWDYSSATLRRSRDHGFSWTTVTPPEFTTAGGTRSINIVLQEDESWLLTFRNRELGNTGNNYYQLLTYFTDDEGDTWTLKSRLPYIADGHRVDELSRLGWNGSHWFMSLKGTLTSSISDFSTDKKYSAIWRSTDGSDWEELREDEQDEVYLKYGIHLMGFAGSTVIAGSPRINGVYRSTDLGDTWTYHAFAVDSTTGTTPIPRRFDDSSYHVPWPIIQDVSNPLNIAMRMDLPSAPPAATEGPTYNGVIRGVNYTDFGGTSVYRYRWDGDLYTESYAPGTAPVLTGRQIMVNNYVYTVGAKVTGTEDYYLSKSGPFWGISPSPHFYRSFDGGITWSRMIFTDQTVQNTAVIAYNPNRKALAGQLGKEMKIIDDFFGTATIRTHKVPTIPMFGDNSQYGIVRSNDNGLHWYYLVSPGFDNTNPLNSENYSWALHYDKNILIFLTPYT